LGKRWIAIFTLVLLWSAINPREYFTWFLEVLPALIAFVLLLLTHKRFPFTPLAYTLILVHCIILMIGGHYTYAEMPLFDWLRDLFQLERNNYDKVGHFAQGFIPAIVGREILIRNRVVTGGHWLALIVVSICLAISAFYEMIEWGVALVLNEAADAFIGAQGYVWDTQSDMAWALTGAVTALLLLSKWHDRQLAALAR
jgi:putative membrane protein